MEITLVLPQRVAEKLVKLSGVLGKSFEELIAEVLLACAEISDPDAKAEIHLELCEKYLREALELLGRGDYIQQFDGRDNSRKCDRAGH